MLSVNTRIEGIRRVLSPKTNSLLSKKNRSLRQDAPGDHYDSDDETHVSNSNNNDVDPFDGDAAEEPDLDDLMMEKSFIQAAPGRQKDSLFIPKEEMSQIRMNDIKPRFPFLRSEIRYLSIHNDSDAEAKAYIQYKKVSRNKVFVLLDDYQEPIALCLADGHKTAYVIYSRRPLENKENNLEAVMHEGATFYPWIRVVVKAPHQDKATFQVWNGRDFIDVSTRYPEQSNRGTDDDTVVTSNSASRRLFAQMIVGPRHEGQVCSSATRNGRGGWNVNVQAGADPAMMLCLTVVLGELMR
jgi:hypothetical protein